MSAALEILTSLDDSIQDLSDSSQCPDPKFSCQEGQTCCPLPDDEVRSWTGQDSVVRIFQPINLPVNSAIKLESCIDKKEVKKSEIVFDLFYVAWKSIHFVNYYLDQCCPTLSPFATCGDRPFNCGDRKFSQKLYFTRKS